MRYRWMVVFLVDGLMASSLGFAAQGEKKAAPPAYDFKGLMQKILDAWGTPDPAMAAPFSDFSDPPQSPTSERKSC